MILCQYGEQIGVIAAIKSVLAIKELNFGKEPFPKHEDYESQEFKCSKSHDDFWKWARSVEEEHRIENEACKASTDLVLFGI